MDQTKKRAKYLRLATIVSIIGNSLLAALVIIMGLIEGSTSLIGNGIDSLTDVVISIVSLSVIAIISRPADKKHPYGHGRAETIATAILAFIIFFAGGQLIYGAVQVLLDPPYIAFNPSNIAIIASAIMIVGKIVLAFVQYKIGKIADSMMIKANAKNMINDVLIASGVLIGLIIARLTGTKLPDLIVTIFIGCWVIKTAIIIFLEVNTELMDGNKNTTPYRVITEAVHNVEGASTPHRARMRRIAGLWDIVFDIYVDPKLSIKDAHNIATKIENIIKTKLDVYDIVIHVEPLGNIQNEVYGLTEEEMNESIIESA